MIVPPLSLGQEEIMAGNLSRYLRYKLALDAAAQLSPKNDEELLENVTVKVVKVKKFQPFTAACKDKRIEEGLELGKDLYEGKKIYLK
jgi:hypothetical protein